MGSNCLLTFTNQILKSFPKFANKLAPSRMITSDPIVEILSNNPSNELFAEFDQSNSTNKSFEIKFTFSKLIPTRWDELCQAWRVSQNEKTFYWLKIPAPDCPDGPYIEWTGQYEPIPETDLDSDNADFIRQMFKNRELCNFSRDFFRKYFFKFSLLEFNPRLTRWHNQFEPV